MLKRFRDFYFFLDEIGILIINQEQNSRGSEDAEHSTALRRKFFSGWRMIILIIGDKLFDLGVF